MGLISFVVCLYRYLYFRSFKTPITFIVRLHSRWGAGAGCHRVYSRFLLIRVPYLSVSDPDPDWIRILSGHWIWIRNPDPDPGGQKWPHKSRKNFKKLHAGCSLLRTEGFFCSLEILYQGMEA